jgi:hypothetical protein
MLAIYAFYSKPFGEQDIRVARTHWAVPYVEFLTLAYSAAKCKSFGWKTRLVTDTFGKNLIVNELGITFDEVLVELDNIEKEPKFWAAGKIYAYTKSVLDNGFEPFIMIDNDAGWHKEPPAHYLESRYRCQHIHHDSNLKTVFHNMAHSLVKATDNVFPYDIYHEAIKDPEGIKGGNAGMVICNDKEVIEEFTRYTWALMKSDYFKKMGKTFADGFNLWNVMVEECLLYHIYRRIRHEAPQTVFDFHGLHFPKGTPNPTGYFHLWMSKRNKEILKRTEERAVKFIDKKVTKKIYEYFKKVPNKSGLVAQAAAGGGLVPSPILSKIRITADV